MVLLELRERFRGPSVNKGWENDDDERDDMFKPKAEVAELKRKLKRAQLNMETLMIETELEANRQAWQPTIENLPIGWRVFLISEINKTHMDRLTFKLEQNRTSMVPRMEEIFHWSTFTQNPQEVNVLMLGGNPCTWPNYNGLGFGTRSVCGANKRVIQNIQRELDSKTYDTTLESWARQGVLCLALSLTTEQRREQAPNHQELWHIFILAVVRRCLDVNPRLTCVTLGSPARTLFKQAIAAGTGILGSQQLLFHAPHPATNDFLCSKVFSNTNARLRQHNLPTVAWAN